MSPGRYAARQRTDVAFGAPAPTGIAPVEEHAQEHRR